MSKEEVEMEMKTPQKNGSGKQSLENSPSSVSSSPLKFDLEDKEIEQAAAELNLGGKEHVRNERRQKQTDFRN